MIEAVAWSAWCLAALAAAEYLAHKYLMHRPRPLRGLFGRHAVQHHAGGRNEKPLIDLSPAWALAYTAPLWGLLALDGAHVPAAVVASHAAGYAVLWTGLHRAMHDVGGAWAARLPIYPALHRHHLGHHRHPGRNFGAVFGPALDLLFGTLAQGNSAVALSCVPLRCERS